VVFPSAIHIESTQTALSVPVQVGAQDFHSVDKLGAFTGTLVVPQIVDFGLTWVLAGHSERRSVFGDDDATVAEKTRIALANGLKVVLCIGETLEEREAGKCVEVTVRQLETVAAAVPASAWAENIVVAYEPIWAIGTGKVASAEQAQEVHKEIRDWMASKIGADAAAACRIVYGGSVKAANSAGLAVQPDIDGFLVGGASLQAQFVDIIRSLE
jgi:triosephosphate isomerase